MNSSDLTDHRQVWNEESDAIALDLVHASRREGQASC